jgi:hypothetical protein
MGATYAIRYRNLQYANAVATATAVAATVYPLQTQTAQAVAQAQARATATRVAQLTATATRPTVEPGIGAGTVTRGGNLRKEPRVAPDTVIGLIWPGDQITFLEQRDVGGQAWYRIRIAKEADNRGGPGVAVGVDGWASATLLSPPAPAATPAP